MYSAQLTAAGSSRLGVTGGQPSPHHLQSPSSSANAQSVIGGHRPSHRVVPYSVPAAAAAATAASLASSSSASSSSSSLGHKSPPIIVPNSGKSPSDYYPPFSPATPPPPSCNLDIKSYLGALYCNYCTALLLLVVFVTNNYHPSACLSC